MIIFLVPVTVEDKVTSFKMYTISIWYFLSCTGAYLHENFQHSLKQKVYIYQTTFDVTTLLVKKLFKNSYLLAITYIEGENE